ncbi:hypothetical protein ACOMHN_047002 [Nucella lapillus]
MSECYTQPAVNQQKLKLKTPVVACKIIGPVRPPGSYGSLWSAEDGCVLAGWLLHRARLGTLMGRLGTLMGRLGTLMGRLGTLVGRLGILSA